MLLLVLQLLLLLLSVTTQAPLVTGQEMRLGLEALLLWQQ
jgi:hypothetical protein